MNQTTRRDLLKGGLAASTTLIISDKLFPASNVAAAAPTSQSVAEPPASDINMDGPESSRQVLLLDHGWRFHLGNADDALKDFRWGVAGSRRDIRQSRPSLDP